MLKSHRRVLIAGAVGLYAVTALVVGVKTHRSIHEIFVGTRPAFQGGVEITAALVSTGVGFTWPVSVPTLWWIGR